MKRKLISYDAFESIKNNSLSNAEHELMEAQPVLGKTLATENLNLVCYGPETALYESNNSYIRTNYKLNESHIDFNNIEQLVIDESTEKNQSRKLLNQMMEAILDDNTAQANELFEAYIKQSLFQRNISEGFDFSTLGKGKKKGKGKKVSMKEKMAGLRKLAAAKRGKKSGKKSTLKFTTAASKMKKMKEWATLAENVFGYVDYKQFGPLLKESVLSQDEKGNVTAVRVPNIKTRNEAKLLSFNWKTLDTDVKVLRGKAKQLAENSEFCKAVAELKRHNAVSNSGKVQESLEEIVSRWSGLLYLTQNELSNIVNEALSSVGATNYDDQTCEFIAEALLTTAHDSYVDRVSKIMNLAGSQLEENTYDYFKNTVNQFYQNLDESSANEMQVYVDLYESLRNAVELSTDETTKRETISHLQNLAAIIEQSAEQDLDVAVAAAEWLGHLVETNLESEDWSVSDSPHITVSGDHPKMGQLAKQGYSPANDGSGDWGVGGATSDGKNKSKNDMTDDMWSGDNVYPNINNPYIPNAMDYKIKGEKTIDADSDQLAHYGNGDTWPALQNPYNK